MHDIRKIRDNPAAFDEAMRNRGAEPCADELIALDDRRKRAVQLEQERQQRRNAISKEIGAAKRENDEDRARALMAEMAELKTGLASTDAKDAEDELRDRLASLPNVPMPDVPEGKDETSNVPLRYDGELPEFGFEPKEHFDLGEALGLMTFDDAARISGARFTVLRGALARLERALGQFMLDMAIAHSDYVEVSPPLLVRDRALFGTGNLPKFEEDLYRTSGNHYLIPTAEVPLTNLARETIHEVSSLPQRYTALTHCFRSEAGSAGRDTRGMLRQHQFLKCELVSITDAETGLAELDRKTAAAGAVLKALNLPYRVMLLCAGDMGFSARRTHDLEVWLPGQGAYREISSCSYCGDFQARRMNARYRDGDGNIGFVHTLNGSGLAVGRTLIAIMENYQNEDGTIRVPQALTRYMDGMTVIGR